LVFSKTAGFRHDSIAAGIQAIQQLGAQNDFSVVATEDAGAFTPVNLAQFEAVVFLNTTGDVLNAAQQTAFENYIEGGGGYVGVHSAADTEYNWPWYGELVGAYFSSHPAIQAATIKVADHVHPSTAGLPDRWLRTDEWYNYQINPRGSVHVLATLDETTYSGGTMGFDHPIAWCQNVALGHSWYTGLGHTEATYSEPLFRQHLLGGIQFAAGAAAGDAGATVNDNFTKVVLDDQTNDPMQLDVAADGRVFYVERGGRLKVWEPATSATRLVGQIPVVTSNEDGLLGLALDPQFGSNQWLYVFYAATTASEQHVSRFTLVNGLLDLSSERVLLTVPLQRSHSNHSGGALGFGPDGILYIALGDNTSPFESDGYAPIDERPGRSDWDAQKSSSNTNDLRGKILRIMPQPNGTYTIPAGNLFPADGSQGRPEIYVMGNRNPFRFSVDSETGWLYWGEVGPDAGGNNPLRGPAGYDEWNQARAAGNFGWPYFVGDNKAYVDYNFATGVSGQPFNPAAPQNNSPNNTGSLNLPPAKPALIWYPYSASPEFPELGTGGRTAMSGPVYHFNAALQSDRKLPAYYDDTLFIYEWSRNWIKEVKLDTAGNVLKINPFMPNMSFLRPMDMKIGPDGAMYLLEWGSGFGGGNADSQLIRIDYHAPLIPPTDLDAAAQASNRVRLSWTDNTASESGFKIEQLVGAGFVPVATVGPSVTTYDVVDLQALTDYTFRVRALDAAGDGPASNSVTVTTPQLTSITGTSGNDTYLVRRNADKLEVFENVPPVGQPTYSSTIAALGTTLTIDTGDGDDALTVDAAGMPLGVEQLIYVAGTGVNSLTLASGMARIDSTAASGTLDTAIGDSAEIITNRLIQNGLVLGSNSKVTLLPDGEVSRLTSLTLGTGATFDLTDNALVVDYSVASPVDFIREKILAGRGGSGLGKPWTDSGITSSKAATGNVADPERYSVGYAENALLPLGPYADYRGIPVDNTSLLIAYTRTGDANLDLIVDDDDVTVVGANYAPQVPKPSWALGDFEYNGFVDDDDVTLLGVFYQPTPPAAVAPATNPETLNDALRPRAESVFVPSSPPEVIANPKRKATVSDLIAEHTFAALSVERPNDQRGARSISERGPKRPSTHIPNAESTTHSARTNSERLLDVLAEAIAQRRQTAIGKNLGDVRVRSFGRIDRDGLWAASVS
jgi:glucose/arabinose dehydrogenase